MKFKYILLLMLSVSLLQAQVRVFTIGDSTMANYDEKEYSGEKEQRGWAQLFPLLVTSKVEVKNAAKNGRSTKSFYHEVWTKLRNELKPGDYVFIQFGHNDEKANGLDTDINDTTARGTAPWGQYQMYLRKYIIETREKGAIPVLFTPIVRRNFKDGKLSPKALHNLSENFSDTTLNYPYAMKSIATEMNVPLIDMTTLTQKLVEGYGPDKSKSLLFINKDDTHLKSEGAYQFAELAVKELIRQRILPKNVFVRNNQK
ncbi:MAG TPA: rhamnogalacturonan acetylesterase [Paludibacter sp.]